MLFPVATLLALLSSLGLAAPDEVVLGEGRSIRGTIVKETAEQVFVDVGSTIVALPRRDVREIRREEGAPETATRATEHLWTEVERAEVSVRENVERVGQGVVLVRVPGSLGSGFTIDAQGHVVTNAHVVQGEQNVTVTVFRRAGGELEKRVFEDVHILAVNPYWDLALLRIDAEELGDFELLPVPFGSVDALRVGEGAFAIGNPLGFERTVSEGIVSVVNRANEGMLYIQTTAPINPGNSGGPLFNMRGEVIGVTSWKTLFTEGLNFAIPVSTVKAFLANRDAFAYDKENPNSGHRYLAPPRKAPRGE